MLWASSQGTEGRVAAALITGAPPDTRLPLASAANSGGSAAIPRNRTRPSFSQNLQPNRGQTRRSVGQATEKSANVELARHMEGVRGAGHDKIWTVFKWMTHPDEVARAPY